MGCWRGRAIILPRSSLVLARWGLPLNLVADVGGEDFGSLDLVDFGLGGGEGGLAACPVAEVDVAEVVLDVVDGFVEAVLLGPLDVAGVGGVGDFQLVEAVLAAFELVGELAEVVDVFGEELVDVLAGVEEVGEGEVLVGEHVVELGGGHWFGPVVSGEQPSPTVSSSTARLVGKCRGARTNRSPATTGLAGFGGVGQSADQEEGFFCLAAGDQAF